MNEYIPYSEKHSIQETQVALHSHHEFNQQDIVSARSAVEADLKEILPRSAEIHGGTVQVELNPADAQMRQNPIPAKLVGFQFSKVRGDGKPAHLLELSGNVVSVNILDYEGWDKFRTESVKYITTVLHSLNLATNPVMAFGLRFIDRYTFSGESSEAKAALLFKSNNEYITRQCFGAGSLWHCHTGWFDDRGRAGRVLNHFNVASGLLDQASTVTIDHQATLHLTSPRQSPPALLIPPEGSLGLCTALDALHDKNKDILKTILLSEMLKRIGLER